VRHLILSLCLAVFTIGAKAQLAVNLTPKPKSLTVSTGKLVLPNKLTIKCKSMPDSIVNEARLFAEQYSKERGTKTKLAKRKGTIALEQRSGMPAEGYRLVITPSGATLTATTTAGFFYGFQSILKMVADDGSLPCCTIDDAPKWGYRGFMLDVSRHFFSAAEVKRFLDLMARYKMNAFHWHLTDDQGWRIPIDKYPKLTTVGATAPNLRMNDMVKGSWMTDKPYGPYSYTKDEIRDVIAYAKRLHIEVIPEVDMPGHFVAALAAYPEYSCTPNEKHEVWVNGGISEDVLNVGNPAAVQFAKDVLTEVMQLFPTKYIHIGGDECPVKAWQDNADCKALMAKLGTDKPRQLQSWFIREIGQFLIDNGRRPILWNESVTAGNANLDWVKEVNPIIFSWFPAEDGCRKAAELGLQTMMTSYSAYYICRGQEPPMTKATVARGTSNPIYTKTTYNYDPTKWAAKPEQLDLMTGVQATFWAEHVVDSCYLEWLALPRLFAVAEAGWSPAEQKNFEDFRQRFAADTTWLRRNNYQFCPNILK